MELIQRFIRPEVLIFDPYSPGLSIDEIREKYKLNNVIKMASNENPLGVSPVVQETIKRNAPLSFRYPSAGNPELCRALGLYLGVDPGRIVCGNGSDEIIDLLIRISACPGRDNILAFKPCFSIYQLQAKLCGVDFRQCPLKPDFSFDWQGLLGLVDEHTKLVFLTNPDNPSGFAVPFSEIETLYMSLPETAILVIDEAYIDFASPLDKFSSLQTALKSERMVILRTFSKLFGLAGLRVGFGIFPRFLADYVRRVRLPFSINVLGEKAAQAALKDSMFKQATLELVLRGRQYLAHELEIMDCEVYPSQANFLMFKPPADARVVFEKLLARGVIVRPLNSYGLSHLIRVSVGTETENKTFIRELRAILH